MGDAEKNRTWSMSMCDLEINDICAWVWGKKKAAA